MRLAATLLALCSLAAVAAVADAGGSEVDFGHVREGEEHPDVRLPTIERDAWLSLSDFRGKKVLLIEFASW